MLPEKSLEKVLVGHYAGQQQVFSPYFPLPTP